MPEDLTPAELYDAVRNRDQAALAQLYRNLRRNEWFYLLQQAGQDAEDVLHRLWMLVVKAIEENRVEHPEQVFLFAHGAARKLCARRNEQRDHIHPVERLAA
jgi:hypothetical protein